MILTPCPYDPINVGRCTTHSTCFSTEYVVAAGTGKADTVCATIHSYNHLSYFY